MNASQSPNVNQMVAKKIATITVLAMKMKKQARLSVNVMKVSKMMALICVGSVETQCSPILSVKAPGLGLFNNQFIVVINYQQGSQLISTKLI